MSEAVPIVVVLGTESQNVPNLKRCSPNKLETLDAVTILLMDLLIGKTVKGLLYAHEGRVNCNLRASEHNCGY